MPHTHIMSDTTSITVNREKKKVGALTSPDTDISHSKEAAKSVLQARASTRAIVALQQGQANMCPYFLDCGDAGAGAAAAATASGIA